MKTTQLYPIKKDSLESILKAWLALKEHDSELSYEAIIARANRLMRKK